MARPRVRAGHLLSYAGLNLLSKATIFLGSFLAFLVQPLVARATLPILGGTSAVWVTCLAAFQALLVAGYWYAHGVGKSVRRESGASESGGVRLPRFHLVLLLLAAGWLAAMSAGFGRLSAWLGGMFPHPALGAFSAATFLAGPVYVLLAANATLVQSLAGGAYRLYSVSNLGSFAGLFAHPLVLEPFVPVRMQWFTLSVGTLAYATLLGWCGRCAAAPSWP